MLRGDLSHAEIAAELEALANEFLGRAVEIDTVRDRLATRQTRLR